MEPKTFKYAKLILLIGVMSIMISPFILTRTSGIIDFSNTGQIGDTIGGITAPISALLGSALVFFALKAQIDANKIIQEQIDHEKKESGYSKNLHYLNSQLNFLHNEIEGFSYLKKSRAKNQDQQDQYFEFKGALAVKEIIEQLKYWGEKDNGEKLKTNTNVAIFLKLLRTFKSLVVMVKDASLRDQDKQYLSNKLEYLFEAKIRPGVDSNENYWPENQEVCHKCGERHAGFPPIFYEIYNDLKSSLMFN